MSDKEYFIELCTDVGTYKYMPLELIKYNVDYGLMYVFMSAMYCVCMHTFHSAHDYMYCIQ